MMMKSELNYKETFMLCKQTKNVIRVRCAMWAAVFVSSSQPIKGGNHLRTWNCCTITTVQGDAIFVHSFFHREMPL